MIEREKVIKGMEYHLKELTVGKTCYECPYLGDNPCEIQLIANALALLKADQAELIRQRDIISKYRKADEFLALHGWEWKDD